MSDLERIPGVSIVCVFNDVSVRQSCLDRSVDAYEGSVPIEYIPVDNTEGDFRSAGAALNYGAQRARHDVIVFVHQDVYLHSLDRIAEVSSYLLNDTWGVLGANGVTHNGLVVGRLRDRVELVGESSPLPTEVDSLDEVLFMVRRKRILQHPLSEEAGLAWHAYAVEYGLRTRSAGLRVGAVDLAITHNSLSANLDKLDVAHGRVARLYPEALPVATTCGRISESIPWWRGVRTLSDHAWRLRWLRESRTARQIYRQLPVRVVLADICYDVDLLGYSTADPMHVFNLDRSGGFAAFQTEPLPLLRRGRPLICRAIRGIEDLITGLDGMHGSASWLVTDVQFSDLRYLRQRSDLDLRVAGVQGGSIWLAGGPMTRDLPAEWSSPRSRARVPNPTIELQA